MSSSQDYSDAFTPATETLMPKKSDDSLSNSTLSYGKESFGTDTLLSTRIYDRPDFLFRALCYAVHAGLILLHIMLLIVYFYHWEHFLNVTTETSKRIKLQTIVTASSQTIGTVRHENQGRDEAQDADRSLLYSSTPQSWSSSRRISLSDET